MAGQEYPPAALSKEVKGTDENDHKGAQSCPKDVERPAVLLPAL